MLRKISFGKVLLLFPFLRQNKDDEIAMLRGLVRQQEDATRLLGEKMRNEAQEHVSANLLKI